MRVVRNIRLIILFSIFLFGQITTSAGNAELGAVLKKLRAKAAPLERPDEQVNRPTEKVAIIKVRQKDTEVCIRRVICGYDELVVLLDLGGELLASACGSEIILAPFDQTCLISRIDTKTRTVVLKRPDREIKLSFPDLPTPNWKTSHSGLAATLEPASRKYQYGSKIKVRFTIENISTRDIVVDLGTKQAKPHFEFFFSHSRFGEVRKPPRHLGSRLFDFKYLKKPLRPKNLAPGEKVILELDLNRFLQHLAGTPCLMASIPIGRAPAWYEVVGIYQQLGNVADNIWTGSLTTNSISFRVLPKEKIVTEFHQIDENGIRWDYEALSKAYAKSRNAGRDRQILDLMVVAKAAHLVPQIIDSIRPGGFMDVEGRIRAIIQLTGYDFSQDFDIERIWQIDHTTKVKSLLRQWWQQNGKQVIESRGAIKEFSIPVHWIKGKD